MNDNQFEQRLQAQLDALPREIRPGRDLWPGIDAALEHEVQRGKRRSRLAGIAASIAVLGLVGLLVVNGRVSQQAELSGLGEVVTNMSRQHESQKQFLLASYEKQPALTDNWQQQLQELDDAAIVIKQALKKDPGDSSLVRLLQKVYQQQIELIQSVHKSRWL